VANYNISTTGIRTTGPSTVDDWTDANCYPASALSGIVEADSDTFVFNENLAGLGTTSYQASAEVTWTKAITVSTRYGANGGGAILGRASGGGVVNINPDSTATFTVNDLKFSGSNISTRIVYLATNIAEKNIVLNRIETIGDGAAVAINISQGNGSVTMNDCIVSGSYSGNIVYANTTLGANSAMVLTIDGLHYDNVTSTRAGEVLACAFRSANTASVTTANISNVTGSINFTNAAGFSWGIECSGVNNVVLEDCNFTVDAIVTGSGNYCTLVRGQDTGNRLTTRPVIRNNIFNHNCPSGDGISVGTDAETGLGFTINPQVHHNVVTGINSAAYSPHGIGVRGLASGDIYANHVKRFHSPLILSLCTNDNVRAFGNLLTDITGTETVGISLKGNSGGVAHNNTVIITPSSVDGNSDCFGIWAREQGATANSASKTYNNNILILVVTPKVGGFATVGVGDANTFSNNNYYSDQALPATSWAYAGTTYATLALWNAAQETNDATDNANFTATVAEIVAAFGDLTPDEVSANATTNGGGLKWWTGANPDTLNEPLSSFDIDQGLQSKNGDFHPTNL